MSLQNRVNKIEAQFHITKEPSDTALFWWGLHRESNPGLPERPPDDWIEYYHGKCLEDLLLDALESKP